MNLMTNCIKFNQVSTLNLRLRETDIYINNIIHKKINVIKIPFLNIKKK